ncbi:MAG TPA: hypothetical protein VFL87_10425 [Thermoleophilaceae bacterium]|nr:hypothetical protein [Thermoleophilaceae bacterium]
MPDERLARDQMERYGLLRPRVRSARLSNVLLAWLIDFLALMYAPGLRHWSRRGIRVSRARFVASWALRTLILFVADAFTRSTAARMREFEEFKQRLSRDLGREVTTEEAVHAWGKAHGYDWPAGPRRCPPPTAYRQLAQASPSSRRYTSRCSIFRLLCGGSSRRRAPISI